MASMTMASSFLGGSAAIAATKQPSTTTTSRRAMVVMAKASLDQKLVVDENQKEGNSTNGRRDMMFAFAAATAFSVAKIALADDEPKRGTEAAKKKYAQVCVSNPTARICRY
ncbi:hypothetical protein L6452_24668 [Arctium lappa]|uniref:Uncharacterized protein n=1 Tax=Arctium lappa TaxID=4217 RepID=A0ACB9AE61_ARCLA|nr:hypothetical protein L6452_24668 [Arctium lappa]